MYTIWPANCTVLTKRSIMFLGPFGFGCWLMGMIFVDRFNSESSKSALKHVLDVLSNEQARIWIYPEGTRNMDAPMLPFKKGAFNIAVEAQCPIIPVVASSYRHFYSHPQRMFNSGRYKVRVLPPIETKGLSRSDVPDLVERIRSDMIDSFHELSGPVFPEPTSH